MSQQLCISCQVFILIVFLLFRVGQNGDILHWGEGPGAGARAEDELVVGTFTSSGYLFIVLVLMVGAACGDQGKYVVSSVIMRKCECSLISFRCCCLTCVDFYSTLQLDPLKLQHTEVKGDLWPW